MSAHEKPLRKNCNSVFMTLHILPQIIAYCKISLNGFIFWFFISTGSHPTISLYPLWTIYCSPYSSGSTSSEALFVQRLGKLTFLVFSYLTSIYCNTESILNFISLHFIPKHSTIFCGVLVLLSFSVTQNNRTVSSMGNGKYHNLVEALVSISNTFTIISLL